MKYWVMKTEPDVCSISDLEKSKTQCWDGVRNYQARNYMMNDMQVGDKILFYHSSAEVIGVAGLAEVSRAAYPDHTQFDKKSEYYDPKATKENPRWYMVDVKFEKKFKKVVTLEDIKNHPDLTGLTILKKGNRLSITPASKEEYEIIKKMGL